MDEVLVVPYEAGLGVNDVLTCGGPGYTIDDLTDPPNGTVVKTPNDFGAFEYTPDPGFTGADSFGYTLYQGMDVADQATAHITVTESCSVIAFQDFYYHAVRDAAIGTGTWFPDERHRGVPAVHRERLDRPHERRRSPPVLTAPSSTPRMSGSPAPTSSPTRSAMPTRP